MEVLSRTSGFRIRFYGETFARSGSCCETLCACLRSRALCIISERRAIRSAQHPQVFCFEVAVEVFGARYVRWPAFCVTCV